MTSPTDHCVADFSICAVGSGVNMSKACYIVEVHKVLKTTGLKYNLHAYGTNIEGPLSKILDAVCKSTEKLHSMDVPRLDTTLRFQTRTDKKMGIDDSIKCVKDACASH